MSWGDEVSRFSINRKLIGIGHPHYVIAEMSGNHNQSFEQAISIIDSAVKVGASAIKL